eukprot:TRINITY_DN9624_c0_g2_i1.p1 TRINITY_DN9624_c0_g2~~TRINITY_DN9624_c0_g2_i1.p1  ORF type:complete len:897 (-),score=151.16 TRINITY_DN9624_c0_g2_i1:142-2832(-)
MLMSGAITLADAQERILDQCRALQPEPAQGLRDMVGRVLAEDLVAPRDVPQAPTSIVDGYAICAADFNGQGSGVFKVRRPRKSGAAGSQMDGEVLQTREAVYVTTGGLLPPRADSVRPEEETSLSADGSIETTSCEKGKWVRQPGSDTAAGTTILRKGRRISPLDLAPLAALGLTSPRVVQKPRVVVFSTGRELVDPHSHTGPLPKEKIFDANRHMLFELAREEGAEVKDMGIIADNEDAISDAIATAAEISEVVVCSGGVSEGDFDFVRPTICQMGRKLFDKVIIKPGKPATCAVSGWQGVSPSSKVLLFGLPGNPASAAVTFQLLVAPALQKLGGLISVGQPVLPVRVRETVAADPQRPEWVRAELTWEGAELVALHTGFQRSSRAASLAGVSALLQLEAGERIEAGGTSKAVIIDRLPANSYRADLGPRMSRQLEAATFRRVVAHLRENPQVQNIDLMNLSGFCRNCLSKWYMKAANVAGVAIDYDNARERIYGMPYDTWKRLHQTPATPAQTAEFEQSSSGHSKAAGNHAFFAPKEEGGCCKRARQSDDDTADRKSVGISGGSIAAASELSDEDDVVGNNEKSEDTFEASAYRQLVAHLRENPQVQNIDLMNLSGFCRNCLAKWYMKSAAEQGVQVSYDSARELVYGMPYEAWKNAHQAPVAASQLRPLDTTTQGGSAATSSVARIAPKHSDVCAGGTEQGQALEAQEAAAVAAATHFPRLRVGILTVSDRAFAKVYEDLSGPAVSESLSRALSNVGGFPADNIVCVRHLIVPDELVEIKCALQDWCAGPEPLNLILTTGGTGFAPRDVTPEATRAVCDKEAPGIALATLQAGSRHHPLALASRLTAGVCRRTVILNLPGKPAAVGECLEPVVPLLLRAVSLCDQPAAVMRS